MSFSQNLSQRLASTLLSAKSLLKIALAGRRGRAIAPESRGGSLIILGNGPSLAKTLADDGQRLRQCPKMAVNFAALTPEIRALEPEYYVLADPHFNNTADPQVARLVATLNGLTHPMTLLTPFRFDTSRFTNPNITCLHFPATGVEGWRRLRHFAIDRGLGMPRPRNVLICAIMCGIWLGFRDIFITGADHSWTRTLSVDSRNRVVSIQPHFYEEAQGEEERIASVYNNVKLHEILESFSIAFKAYHDIADYAAARGITVTNATPGSFIDAFPRGAL